MHSPAIVDLLQGTVGANRGKAYVWPAQEFPVLALGATIASGASSIFVRGTVT